MDDEDILCTWNRASTTSRNPNSNDTSIPVYRIHESNTGMSITKANVSLIPSSTYANVSIRPFKRKILLRKMEKKHTPSICFQIYKFYISPLLVQYLQNKHYSDRTTFDVNIVQYIANKKNIGSILFF